MLRPMGESSSPNLVGALCTSSHAGNYPDAIAAPNYMGGNNIDYMISLKL
jgi:hypothetical protein